MQAAVSPPAAEPSRNSEQSGTALVLALFFTVVTTGIVFTGSLVQKSNREKTRTNFRLNSQAMQFARAGLTETVSWFRRQTSQPVVDFEPIVDTSVSPPVVDTDEPEVGIVREFRIEGKVFGRYEVWKEWTTDPIEERRLWREKHAVVDKSRERGTGADGTAWRVRSIGYVFERTDDTGRFDELPNRVLAQETLEIEITRRTLTLPGQAALIVGDGNSAHVNTYGRIEGGTNGGGIYFPAGTGKPTTGPTNEQRVSGNPPLAQSPGAIDLSPEFVFGLSYAELKASADHVVTDARDMLDEIPYGAIVVIEMNSVTFDSSLPLRGFGVVYIRGNCTLNSGNNSMFSGLLYVDGNLTVRAPSEIEGAAIVTGNFNIQGSGDYAVVRYNDEVLNLLRREIGQYRFLGPFRPIHRTL